MYLAFLQLMYWDEHIMLIIHTVNLYGYHILVIVNSGSNSTKEALHATEQGFAVGMHASLQINPYYGKTSMPGELQAQDVALGSCYMFAHTRLNSGVRLILAADVEIGANVNGWL